MASGYVIARYQIMRFRRDKARDRLLLNDELVDKILYEGIDKYKENNGMLELLVSCVGQSTGQRAQNPASGLQFRNQD